MQKVTNIKCKDTNIKYISGGVVYVLPDIKKAPLKCTISFLAINLNKYDMIINFKSFLSS